MQKITQLKSCSGCHACYNACPVGCISMEYDAEGFLYPKIDKEKCINCGKCEKHCPQNIAIRKELANAANELEGPIYKILRKLIEKFKLF